MGRVSGFWSYVGVRCGWVGGCVRGVGELGAILE